MSKPNKRILARLESKWINLENKRLIWSKNRNEVDPEIHHTAHTEYWDYARQHDYHSESFFLKFGIRKPSDKKTPIYIEDINENWNDTFSEVLSL